jgi:adenosylmethionine-8-amino-7-oxononanoate aminotransferase
VAATNLAGRTLADLFTTGGGEAVETAWKLARQYFALRGKLGKYKVISRSVAYHGTTMGALAITGIPEAKAAFEPDRGDPVVQLAPPLICDQSHFDEIEQILRTVLTEAWARI